MQKLQCAYITLNLYFCITVLVGVFSRPRKQPLHSGS